MATTIAFHTLGCKLNFSESNFLENQCEAAGFEKIDFGSPADIYVINTCSVTDFADRKCRKAIRKAKSLNSDSFVVVTGCYAQLKPREVIDLEGVNLVLGSAEKFQLLDYLNAHYSTRSSGLIHCSEIQISETFDSAFSFGSRTRAFLKIQDGCDYRCSFCTIPAARGKSRSDRIDQVVKKTRMLASSGVNEIVLTGVNIGDFGKSVGSGEDFFQLLSALDAVGEMNRIRISSIEPNLCSDDMIRLVASSKRLMPHFHMPLQSGTDKILRLMRRRYRRDLYADRVAMIRNLIPHASIGADVIVGFPNESDGDFHETVDFVQSLDISYLHIFTFSERPNTSALGLGNPVPIGIRRKRNAFLRAISLEKQKKFSSRFLGSVRPVLVEPHSPGNCLTGYTDNYLKVIIPDRKNLVGSICDIRLDHALENGTVLSGSYAKKPVMSGLMTS